jgi:N-terminal acetyltransferase B complex non-catalytic subunit
LLKCQKHDEAVALCDEVFSARPTDGDILLALSQILRHLERHQDNISLYEDAFKKEPRNEELGSQTFMAMIRIGSWKLAQQLSHKLSRTFPEEHRYLSWSVMCAFLQACDPAIDGKTKNILLGLALRLFQQLPPHVGHTASADKLCLLLEIYLSFTEPKLVDAYDVLATDAGHAMFGSSLAVDERRQMIWSKLHKHAEEQDLSKQRLERGCVPRPFS